MSGIVYTIDSDGYIVAERKMNFDDAVEQYFGQRDSKGRMLYVAVEGKEIPYKRKPKMLMTGNKKP